MGSGADHCLCQLGAPRRQTAIYDLLHDVGYAGDAIGCGHGLLQLLGVMPVCGIAPFPMDGGVQMRRRLTLHATEAATSGCSLSIRIATIGTSKLGDPSAMVRSAWVMVSAARWNRYGCGTKSTILVVLGRRCRPRRSGQTLPRVAGRECKGGNSRLPLVALATRWVCLKTRFPHDKRLQPMTSQARDMQSLLFF